jgi:proline dehydrogenase
MVAAGFGRRRAGGPSGLYFFGGPRGPDGPPLPPAYTPVRGAAKVVGGVTGLVRAPVLWVTEQAVVRRAMQGSAIGKRFAGRFVAGDSLDDGIIAARQLSGRGIATLLDHLGENVSSSEQASVAADAYIEAIRRGRETPGIDCMVSVKLTQLGLDSGVDVCAENMVRVLQAAEEQDPPLRVMIDMEASEYVDRTLDLYLALRSRHLVGVCLQSYLRRTGADAERIAGPDAVVRVTKGAYLEPREIAFQRRDEVSRSFISVTKTLFEHRSAVHLATHDEHLVAGARAYLHRTGVPRERFEFQLLYGIRRDLQNRLVEGGEPVRVYVPYGTQWYPYLTRRLAERPANVWFFLSNALRPRG